MTGFLVVDSADLPIFNPNSYSSKGAVKANFEDDILSGPADSWPDYLIDIPLEIVENENYKLHFYACSSGNGAESVMQHITVDMDEMTAYSKSHQSFTLQSDNGFRAHIWTPSNYAKHDWLKTINLISSVSKNRAAFAAYKEHKAKRDETVEVKKHEYSLFSAIKERIALASEIFGNIGGSTKSIQDEVGKMIEEKNSKFPSFESLCTHGTLSGEIRDITHSTDELDYLALTSVDKSSSESLTSEDAAKRRRKTVTAVQKNVFNVDPKYMPPIRAFFMYAVLTGMFVAGWYAPAKK